MGFSCEIFQGSKNLTKDDFIHYQLLGLGPNNAEATEAPYRVSDFRSVVSSASYADRLKDAAQDCFRQLQHMAKANLDSLEAHHDCPCCKCPPKEPQWWSVESLKNLLSVDATTITKIHGGY